MLDDAGKPLALHLERWSDHGRRLILGSQLNARIRALQPDQGGAFLETETGAEAFLRLQKAHSITEGQALNVIVAAEAREDKLPRVEFFNENSSPPDSLAWPECVIEDVSAGNQLIAAAFDEALSSTLTLPGGGRLRIERTSALTAVDIDTAGRKGKGSAASRALKINLEACGELARQMRLRNLGGLVVLDCVAPLNAGSRQKIKGAMKSELKAAGLVSNTVLAPSQLGLLELSLPWRKTPISDRILDSRTDTSDETLCLEGLRMLEQTAIGNRMDKFTLELPTRAFQWLGKTGAPLKDLLADKYGQRLSFTASDQPKPSVYQTE